MKFRLLSLVLVVALLFALFPAAPASAQAANPTQNIPVTGTVDFPVGHEVYPDGATGTFSGLFSIQRFVVKSGTLFARGVTSGTLAGPGGLFNEQVQKTVEIPVTAINGTPLSGASAARDGVIAQQQGQCEILDLSLGPVDLDLLGLVVHLDEVNLTITAEQGPGNLLGNLLCAIVGLLDGPAPIAGLLQAIANLLNQILGILNRL